MHQAAENVIRQRMERTAQALRKNNMEAICVDSAAEVLPLLEQWIAPGSSVGAGGSVTLAECGVEQFLNSGKVKYLNRNAPGLTPEEREEVTRAHFSADWFCAAPTPLQTAVKFSMWTALPTALRRLPLARATWRWWPAITSW